MKNFFLLTLAIILSANTFAQSNNSKIRAGIGLIYASDINNLGLNINGVYQFDDEWEGAACFTHILENNYMSYNIIDLDTHYRFHQNDTNLDMYGIAGLAFTSWKFSYSTFGISDSYTRTGLNLGLGANIKISDNLNLAPEIRYTITDASYMRLGASVQYVFK